MIKRNARKLTYAFLMALSVLAWAAPPGDRYALQRESFAKALKAQKAGQHSLAGQLIAGLEDYPLYAYFVYNDLRRRTHRFPTEEIARFLSNYDNSYLASRMREQWLAQLGSAQRWSDFLRFYRPTDDPDLRCLQLKARLATGLDAGLMADTRAIWLSAESLPKTCDGPFKKLYASELMNDDLVWARIRLAMGANKPKLARYLSQRLIGRAAQGKAKLWLQAHNSPRSVLARRDADDDDDTRAIVLHALNRIARRSIKGAESAWDGVAKHYTFSSHERGLARAIIALAAARADDPRRLALLDAVPNESVTPDIERYRIREALLAGDWDKLARWTAGEPIGGVNPLRWRYWRARALAVRGDQAAARALYEQLAKERDYYGFLAADALDLPYQYNRVAVAPTVSEVDAIKAVPGLARAHELYLMDRKYQARREWAYEVRRFNTRQLEVAASVAAQWGWPDSAIFALGRAKSYDDLDLRFPLLYLAEVKQNAARRKLSAARVMAIIRSESAFVADARSPAGALGLMQLLPATARETAKRVGIKLRSARQLQLADKNIALGSAYLAQMLKRFGGNFAMAAAAYNAGPHRVRQWRKASCTVADVWIDTIPFTETRRYVRRAYFYTALYQSRMGQAVTRITNEMPPVPASGSNSNADCKT